MNTFRFMLMCTTVVSCAVPLFSAEIKGVVESVSQKTIRITTESEQFPVAGDKLQVSVEIPGVDVLAEVATGSVTGIDGTTIIGTIKGASARVEPGQLVSINSPSPVARPAAPKRREPARNDSPNEVSLVDLARVVEMHERELARMRQLFAAGAASKRDERDAELSFLEAKERLCAAKAKAGDRTAASSLSNLEQIVKLRQLHLGQLRHLVAVGAVTQQEFKDAETALLDAKDRLATAREHGAPPSSIPIAPPNSIPVAPPSSIPVTEKPDAASRRILGSWKSNWGRVEFRQTGGRIVGTIFYDRGGTSTIIGTFQGDVFVASWRNSFGESGSLALRFNGSRMSGDWSRSFPNEGTGPIRLTRDDEK